MKTYHIVGMSQNRVIGKDNQLPWHFSEDLKHFKETTSGSTVIMGRKTYESIGRPLPNRQNFVLSRNSEIATPPSEARNDDSRVKYFTTVDDALSAVRTDKAFIIGGANVYRQTFDKIEGIYLTKIYQDYEGDAFYEEIPSDFKEVSSRKLQDNPLVEVIYYERS